MQLKQFAGCNNFNSRMSGEERFFSNAVSMRITKKFDCFQYFPYTVYILLQILESAIWLSSNTNFVQLLIFTRNVSQQLFKNFNDLIDIYSNKIVNHRKALPFSCTELQRWKVNSIWFTGYTSRSFRSLNCIFVRRKLLEFIRINIQWWHFEFNTPLYRLNVFETSSIIYKWTNLIFKFLLL